MSYQQVDFFEDIQPNLCGSDDAPASEAKPNPVRIRMRLDRIIAEAQAATAMPWTKSKEKLYQAMVPQLSLGLPEKEASQYLCDFEKELQRLKL